MKVGVKLWSRDKNDLKKYSFADFIEIMAVPNTPLEQFKSYDYEYTIHAPHSQFGLNIADPAVEKRNLKLIKWAIKAADELKAKIIVVHAGYITEKMNIKSPAEEMKRLLAKVYDERICVENIIAGEEGRGKEATPEEIRQVVADNLKFCLDFGHAIGAANAMGKKYKPFVEEFLKLKPSYFHLSGTDTTKTTDGHLSLFEGNLNINWAKGLIKKHNKPVCLETPMDIEQRRKEIKFMKN